MTSISFPNQIFFLAANEKWDVSYQACTSKLQLLARPQNELVIFGKNPQSKKSKEMLIDWTRTVATKFLKQEMVFISEKTQLPFQKISIRDQRTRWGSCNEHKAINLNYKLIFLPQDLMRHILIHELCHTVHLNHSAHFWQLVRTFDPLFQTNRKLVRVASRYIPSWLW